MPITLSQVASNTAMATLNFEQGVLNVEYYPLRITDEMLAHLQTLNSQSIDEANALLKMQQVSEMLVGIIKSWDFLEDDGETPIPLTIERLSRLSPIIKMLAVQAIMGSIRPETIAPQMQNP